MDPLLFGLQGLREVFNVHPVFVHFPIALFPSALLLYGLGIVLDWRAACIAGRACLYLATAGTLIAVVTGLTAQSIPHNERIHHLMMTHRTLGLTIAPLALLLTGWSFRHKAQQPTFRYGFLLTLTVVTGLVTQTADLGARMVFVEGAGVKAAIPVINKSHQHDHREAEAEPQHHHEEGHQHSH
ncbi:MAG: DUF2231 domain-containing protein [Candidatus Omnitrophica bacterium]|nr:DUF2231 domain-containing protein [Candidatus Omnitrophota bacterium]